MKTKFLLIAFLILSLYTSAQIYCPFVYYVTTGTNTVSFSPNSSYSSGQFHQTWNFGDSSALSTQSNPVHTYSSSGSHYVTCTNYDSTNTIVCSTGNLIYLNPPYTCYFNMSQLSVPDSFVVSTQPLSGATVEWDFGDGSPNSTANPEYHFYTSPGTYNCTSTQRDSASNIICQNSQQVIIGINCAYSAMVDTGNPSRVNFTDLSSSPFVYWDFGDGNTDSGSYVSHIYASSGMFTICMTTTDSIGNTMCQVCDSMPVGPGCSFTATPNSSTFGFDFLTNPNGYQLTWDFGDGNTGAGAAISHSYASPGTYTVCMNQIDSVTSNTICSTCQSLHAGTYCQASWLSSQQGLTVYFFDQSTVDPTASYLWDFGDGGTSTSRFPQHTYASSGTYTICLHYANNTCNSIFCDSIYVGSINPTCSALFAIVQMAPYQVAIVNLATGNSLHYNWDYGDGMSDTIANPTHYYSTTGSYNVCLSVSDTTGCSDIFCDSLNVDSAGNIFRSTQSGFTVVVMLPGQLTSASTVSTPSKELKIYPNPFNAELNLSTGDEKNGMYTIYSVEQKLISSGNIMNGQARIETTKLAIGSYLIEVKLEDGTKINRMIIKR